EWAPLPGGGTRFTLAEGARFWNGEPVSAREVAAALANGAGRDAWIESVSVTDDRTVEVRHRGDVRLFSSSSLIVAKPVPGSEWPVGTGDYRIESVGQGAARSGREV